MRDRLRAFPYPSLPIACTLCNSEPLLSLCFFSLAASFGRAWAQQEGAAFSPCFSGLGSTTDQSETALAAQLETSPLRLPWRQLRGQHSHKSAIAMLNIQEGLDLYTEPCSPQNGPPIRVFCVLNPKCARCTGVRQADSSTPTPWTVVT